MSLLGNQPPSGAAIFLYISSAPSAQNGLCKIPRLNVSLLCLLSTLGLFLPVVDAQRLPPPGLSVYPGQPHAYSEPQPLRVPEFPSVLLPSMCLCLPYLAN